MRQCKKWAAIIAAMLLLSNITIAFPNDTPIINQQKVIRTLKNQSSIPILFPSKILNTSGTKLYLSANSYGMNPDYQKFWQLNVDVTPTCQGTKICNIGFISAEKDGKLDYYYMNLRDNRNHLKEPVKLKNNITGYYTPFHIQASSVNPTLEWKIDGILYTLSWRIKADPAQQKQTLIEIANSALAR